MTKIYLTVCNHIKHVILSVFIKYAEMPGTIGTESCKNVCGMYKQTRADLGATVCPSNTFG